MKRQKPPFGARADNLPIEDSLDPTATTVAEPVIASPAGPVPVSWSLDAIVARINPHYAAILILPWLMFVINPNWLFQGFDHMDPWYYFGLSIHFPRFQRLVQSYPGERMTWILPARLFVALFSPVYGWLIFHLCVYWFSTFSLYSLIRRFAGATTALVTAIFMASHPFFFAANGWTYVDSGSIAYIFAALLSLAATRRARNPWPYLVLGGMCWAAAGYNYLLWWLLTPALPLLYWAFADDAMLQDADGKWNIRGIGFAAAYCAVGMVIATLLMAICHYLFLGANNRFFFEDNLGAATVNLTLQKGQATWGQQSFDWLTTGGWIMFPVLAFLTSIIAFVRHVFFEKRLSRLSLGVITAYSYCFLSLVYMTVKENHILQFDYYADILIPFEFLVLGLLVLRTPRSTSKVLVAIVLSIAVGISLAALWRLKAFHPAGRNILWQYPFGIGAVVLVSWWRRTSTWIVAVLALAVAEFALVPAYPNSAWTLEYNGIAAMRRLAEAIDIISQNTPMNQRPVFWFNNYIDPFTLEFRAIMCSFQTHGLSMQKYPEPDPSKKYPAGAVLVLITRERDVFESANAKLTKLGMPLRQFNQHQITGAGYTNITPVAYWLTFTEVLPPPLASAQ